MLKRRTMIAGGLGAVLLGGSYLGTSHLGSATSIHATLTPEEAHAAAGKDEILFVDIRRPDEWSKTGVGQFAVPIDLRDLDFIELVRAAQSSPDQPVALICARGVRSARTSERLKKAGFDNIIDIPEGMLGSKAGPGWLKSNLPTVSYK